MKRIIILLIMLFLVCSCDIEYNLVINKESLDESILVTTDVTNPEIYLESTVEEEIKMHFNNYEPIYFNPENYDFYEGGYQQGTIYYSNEEYKNNTIYGIKYMHNFNYTDYYRSSAVKQCYDEINVVKYNETYYSLRTSNKCGLFEAYPLLSTLNIVIATDLEVISHNADDIIDNQYIWYLDRNNYNKSVRMSFNTAEENEETEDSNTTDDNIDEEENEKDKIEESKEEKDENNNLAIIIGIIVLFVVIIVVIALKFIYF